MRLVLASQSPRRLELLRGIGLHPEVVVPDIDEAPLDGESPPATVLRLARQKARVVAARTHADALVLAADTVVVSDGLALGKPVDVADQRRMLGRLSGRAHEVLTGVCLLDCASGREEVELAATRVVFAALDPATLEWYISSGEGLDKAGGYAVQGLGALFIPEISGSWSNVVGLPLELTQRLAQSIGLDLRIAGSSASGLAAGA